MRRGEEMEGAVDLEEGWKGRPLSRVGPTATRGGSGEEEQLIQGSSIGSGSGMGMGMGGVTEMDLIDENDERDAYDDDDD